MIHLGLPLYSLKKNNKKSSAFFLKEFVRTIIIPVVADKWLYEWVIWIINLNDLLKNTELFKNVIESFTIGSKTLSASEILKLHTVLVGTSF